MAVLRHTPPALGPTRVPLRCRSFGQRGDRLLEEDHLQDQDYDRGEREPYQDIYDPDCDPPLAFPAGQEFLELVGLGHALASLVANLFWLAECLCQQRRQTASVAFPAVPYDYKHDGVGRCARAAIVSGIVRTLFSQCDQAASRARYSICSLLGLRLALRSKNSA
jgi:hypothetical protein